MAKSKWPLIQEKLGQIEQWTKDGLSEIQIIRNLGVGKTTWEVYKKEHNELAEVLKKGREVQIKEVENSLYKNATGFYYYVEEAYKVKDTDGNERLEKISVKKFKAPETGAICFFLKNKDKANWTDNPQMMDLKREELDVRKSAAEFKEW